MGGEEFLAGEVLGYGAYLCLRVEDVEAARREGAGRIAALAARLGLRNEFEAAAVPLSRESFALITRRGATAADIADSPVQDAAAMIHVSSARAETVDELSGEVSRVMSGAGHVKAYRGQSRPKNYTSAAMDKWAYARQVAQQPGPAMPNAFFVPLSKTADWWKKGWMERHTYFLPRYDDEGRMLNEGHALATEAGIACLLRRTYRHAVSPAPAGEYDFLTYFECADEAVPIFHQVCAALRDVKRNPEWRFVREGPTWQGRRVPTWEALFA